MKLSKTKKSLYGNLQTVKMRRRHRLFTVEGDKAVADTSKYFDIEAIVKVEGYSLHGLSECNLLDDKIYEVSESEMKELSYFSTPSSVLGVFRIPEVELEDDLKVDDTKLHLVLDGVRDPGNMGTIIRTAHWFGIFTIYASHDCVDCYNPKVVQSSMGSLGAVRVRYCNLEELLNINNTMPVYGTLLEGENIFKAALKNRGFLVMGNEGVGISEKIRGRITCGLNIPPATSNHGESLNVAIATGIVLSCFESLRY